MCGHSSVVERLVANEKVEGSTPFARSKIIMNKVNQLNIEELFNLAVQNQKKKNLDEAKKIYNNILKSHPKFVEAYNNLGLIFRSEGENEKAIKCYQKAIKINPNSINAYNNLGLIFQKIGENKKAKDCYEKVIENDPNFIMAQYNLGLIFRQLGENEKAITCYQKVIKINPKIVNAHNNLGLAFADLGRYREAIDCYVVALNYDDKHKKAKENLISALTYYKSDNKNPIVVTHNILKKTHEEFKENFKNLDLENFFKKSFKIFESIEKNIGDIDYIETQIYRRNSINLNCGRHHKVFNQFDIIPKFCFNCFKVQIEPKNIMELIKLSFIFDSFNFPNNNWRKCMIELRPDVSGTYKGLIYCTSMNEAKKIMSDISPILKKVLEYKVSIKRGCSEFYNLFPNFKQTNKEESNFMNFDDSWNQIEQKVDNENALEQKKLVASILGFSISDFMIINHWLNYAKIINDTSYKNISNNFTYSNFVAEKMLNQIEFRRKEFLC